MPDKITPDPLAGGAPGFPDATKNNAEVAAKLVAQGQEGLPKPEDYKAADEALDALALQVKPATPEDTPVVTPEEKKAAEEAAAKAAAEAAAKEAEKKAADEAAAKKSDEFFKDAPSLPPGASPKSAEAFATIKLRATQEIEAREAKLAELQKQLAEVQEKAKQPPAELTAAQKELEDLRTWRAKLDVEFDPKFKEYDRKVAETNEFIYAQLRQNPVITPEVIKEIEKYGGPAKCILTKVFEAAKDPVLENIVQSKIAEVKMLEFQKQKAMDSAKENIQQYVQQRQQEMQQLTVGHREQTQSILNQTLPKFEWMAERKPAANAKPDEIKAAEDHNKFVAELKGQIATSLQDDSPEMRGILITGLAKLFYLQRVQAEQTAELAATKKLLADANERLDKIKAASVNRSRNSNAPAGGTPPVKSAAPPIGQPATVALDELMKGVMEKRQAANA
jgi:hypothetical protein